MGEGKGGDTNVIDYRRRRDFILKAQERERERKL